MNEQTKEEGVLISELKKKIEEEGIIINNFFIRKYTKKFAHDYREATIAKFLEIYDCNKNVYITISIKNNMPSYFDYKAREDYREYLSTQKIKKIEVDDLCVSFDDMNIKIAVVGNKYRIVSDEL
jgi:hypothetical protein